MSSLCWNRRTQTHHSDTVIMFSGSFDHSSSYFSSAVRPGEHEEIVHAITAGGHPELSQRKTTVRSGLVVFLILTINGNHAMS